jgi:glycosidase
MHSIIDEQAVFPRRAPQILGRIGKRALLLIIAHFLSTPWSSLAQKVKPGAVIYGVLPTVFGAKPLESVTNRVDYLADQGADILWLSPLQPSDDPSAISYAVTDYRALREDFGSKSDLTALVSRAHARGLKVIMDFVPNHTSSAHPFYFDAQQKGKDSPFYEYYCRDEKGKPTHYFDWKNLPNLNYENPKVVDWMFENMAYWIRAYDIDGFRMDAAWGLRERSPQAWPELIKKLSAVKPLILLAEASSRDTYYRAKGFDLTYDWTGKLGEWAWEGVFKKPQDAAHQLYEIFEKYPPEPSTVRFLNNNDTGKRFVSKYGLPMARLSAILAHTIPGVMLVYSGDEVGAEFEPYEDPAPISWDDLHTLRPLYRDLAHLRKSQEALREGDFSLMPVADSPGILAFTRSSRDDLVLVVLNFGKAVESKIPWPRGARVGKTAIEELLHEGNVSW